ncbi:CDP-glycerol glycerophosphotransferase family protein [Endozoicomonas sp. SCSIO W0465]|uniref:CDP-glycerol glycerophosphotransferase family protein n=1 Tax=Endozoicomonas sp. SCSIO W0465 TaxID=2918516 RepID=UPI0020759CCA|nr:CDP-glycerol glycerophosphotransferase family protein [Endozoicomonas sp. SCSIO W0465]USE35160.1 CDP-glycerol glycerophosphotransferase family protein [Endozoicomonas sp. SCSIO W0465]
MKNYKLKYLPASIILSVFWLIFAPTSYSSDADYIKTAVLFVAYDQGESNAFLRIQERLKNSNIPYRILAMGHAAEIFKDDPALIPVGQLTHNEALYENRDQPLNQKLVYNLAERISAKIVYTGMASRAQAQIANTWDTRGAKVIAFYDNFDPVDSINYVQPFLEELRYIDEFHVPSKTTALSFQSIASSLGAEVTVTGQPALEDWDRIHEETDIFLLRETLNIHPEQPVVLFAGDYSSSYLQAFQTFIAATRLLPNILFLVSYHPKLDGDLERRIIAAQSDGNVHLLHHGTYSTATISTIASAVIVHKSSVAQQAIYRGKPVIYVADENYQNLMLTEQLAIRASQPEPLAIMINAHIMGYRPPAVAENLGIPDVPSRTISKLIIDELRRKSDTKS